MKFVCCFRHIQSQLIQPGLIYIHTVRSQIPGLRLILCQGINIPVRTFVIVSRIACFSSSGIALKFGAVSGLSKIIIQRDKSALASVIQYQFLRDTIGAEYIRKFLSPETIRGNFLSSSHCCRQEADRFRYPLPSPLPAFCQIIIIIVGDKAVCLKCNCNFFFSAFLRYLYISSCSSCGFCCFCCFTTACRAHSQNA